MAPTAITTLAHQARDLAADAVTSLGPLAARTILQTRDDDDDDDDNDRSEDETDPHQGVTDYHDISNIAVFVIIGLIGVAFVLTGIWFFFWAKNGGFYFKENDWQEYKSTVLRRKGPNGTLLSGATPTTDLGGGSVYKDYDDHDNRTVVTESTGLSGFTAGASDIAGREKRERKRQQKKDREREKKRRSEKEKEKSKDRNRSRDDRGAGLHGHHVDEHGNLIDEYAEHDAKQHLRSYRHEKPARVGGLNKESEASEWDGSTNPADSAVSSNLLSNRQSTPTSSPAPKGSGSGPVTTPTPASGTRGIRKVYSTADRNAERENERIRAEARRLAERGRSVADSGGSPQRPSRRDFSYQCAGSAISESDVGLQRGGGGSVPGGWADSDAGSSEVGTKSYQHSRYLPGTSNGPGVGAGSDYAEEKRRNRRQGGYRRGRD